MDPNELVTITNKKTNQIKQVPRLELPKYGLPPDYNSPADTFAKGISDSNNTQKVTDLPTTYQGATQFALSKQGFQPKSVDQQKAEDVRKDLAKNAQGIITVLDAGKAGKLKGQAYKDALDFASSRFAASSGFGEGGKALTEPELTILGGSIPVIQQQGANLLQRAMGIVPAQKGHVVDSEDTLRRKAQLAIAAANGNVDPSQLDQLYGASDTKGERKTDFGSIVGNALLDAKDIGNSILGSPAKVLQNYKQHPTDLLPPIGPVNDLGMGPLNTLTTAAQNSAPAILNEYNQATGRPFEGGDILGRAGQHAAEHPLNTFLDALPLIKGATPLLVKGGVKGLPPAEGGSGGLLPEITAESSGAVKSNLGSNLRQNVRKINVGPTIGGPQREARVNQTLDNLGVQGTASEQYAQIQPKMNQLSDTIYKELSTNPKQVSLDTVEGDFMNNLNDQLLTKSLEAKTAKKEISGFLQDVYKTESGGQPIPQNISTLELFSLKKKVNELYKGVAKKLDNGTPLTDREKVISAARQTLDDIIAQEHPNVKQATLMQSDLYDASESLHAARNKLPAIRLFGNNIPVPYAQNVEDFIGRNLQKVGQ